MSFMSFKHFHISSRPVSLCVFMVGDAPSGKKTCNLGCVNTTLAQINLLSWETGEFPAESPHIWAAEGLPPSGISSSPGASSLAHPPLLPSGSVNSLSRQLEQFSQQPKSRRLSSWLKTWLFGRPVTSGPVGGASRRGVHADRRQRKQEHLLSRGCQREEQPVRPCLGSGSLAVTSSCPFKALTVSRP